MERRFVEGSEICGVQIREECAFLEVGVAVLAAFVEGYSFRGNLVGEFRIPFGQSPDKQNVHGSAGGGFDRSSGVAEGQDVRFGLRRQRDIDIAEGSDVPPGEGSEHTDEVRLRYTPEYFRPNGCFCFAHGFYHPFRYTCIGGAKASYPYRPEE